MIYKRLSSWKREKCWDWRFAVTISETEQREAEVIVAIALFVGSTQDRLPWWLSWWRIHLQRRSQFNAWVRKTPWRRDKLPIRISLGFPDGSDAKESTCNVGDLGLIPGLGRSPGGGHGNHCSILAWKIPGQRSLAGYSPWGSKESDTIELLSTEDWRWLTKEVWLSIVRPGDWRH